MEEKKSEIDFIVSDAIKIKHIKQKYSFSIKNDDNIQEVYAWMEANEVKVAPVNIDGKKAFYIDIEDIRELKEDEYSIEPYIKEIHEKQLVKSNEPLENVFNILLEYEWFAVQDRDNYIWIININDLASPVINIYLFTNLISIEHGLRRLLGSYTNTQITEAASENVNDSDNDPVYLSKVFKLVSDVERLISDLGYSRSAFKKFTGRLLALRNHIAHGRNILNIKKTTHEAVTLIISIKDFLNQISNLILNRDQVWDVYLDTLIIESETNNIYSGPDALPLPTLDNSYIITAHNPFEKVLSDIQNRKRNQFLKKVLKLYSQDVKEVNGTSRCFQWNEESFMISGISREKACDIAAKFGQRAIFELSEDYMYVVSVDGTVNAKRSRFI